MSDLQLKNEKKGRAAKNKKIMIGRWQWQSVECRGTNRRRRLLVGARSLIVIVVCSVDCGRKRVVRVERCTSRVWRDAGPGRRLLVAGVDEVESERLERIAVRMLHENNCNTQTQTETKKHVSQR